MREVVSEIRKNNENSINLDILLREANSKENLLKWVRHLEKPKDSTLDQF